MPYEPGACEDILRSDAERLSNSSETYWFSLIEGLYEHRVAHKIHRFIMVYHTFP